MFTTHTLLVYNKQEIKMKVQMIQELCIMCETTLLSSVFSMGGTEFPWRNVLILQIFVTIVILAPSAVLSGQIQVMWSEL